VTEVEAAATDYLDPATGKPLKKVQEESYLFRLSNYHAAIEAHIRGCPQFVQPETRRNEARERAHAPPLPSDAAHARTHTYAPSLLPSPPQRPDTHTHASHTHPCPPLVRSWTA
jgi:uncharacterized membrane protein